MTLLVRLVESMDLPVMPRVILLQTRKKLGTGWNGKYSLAATKGGFAT